MANGPTQTVATIGEISNWKHVIVAEFWFLVDFLELVVKDGLGSFLLPVG